MPTPGSPSSSSSAPPLPDVRAFTTSSCPSDPPATLVAFRASEGESQRKLRLKSLFETIPETPPPLPLRRGVISEEEAERENSLAASTSAKAANFVTVSVSSANGMSKEERDEENRRIYAHELWGLCSKIPSSSSSTSGAGVPPLQPQSSSLNAAPVRWSAFERYAEEKELELWRLFVELDVDHDMLLRKEEVKEACKRAGMKIKEGSVEEFIRAVDKDGDGAISFEEWRDFLLLLPRRASIGEIFKFYQTHRLHRPSMSQLTQDGDVVVGRGKTGWNKLLGKSAIPNFLASSSSKSSSSSSSNSPPLDKKEVVHSPTAGLMDLKASEEKNDERIWAEAAAQNKLLRKATKEKSLAALKAKASVAAAVSYSITPGGIDGGKGKGKERENLELAGEQVAERDVDGFLEGEEDEECHEREGATHGMFAGAGKFLLAGGLAGAVSRTATAPFDRLKVYLITSPSYHRPPPVPPPPGSNLPPVKAHRTNAGSIPAAVRALWRQGGGLGAFWTGNGLNVVKIFPESAIKFLSYESAKRVFAEYWDDVPDQTLISNSSRFLAGGIGGVVSQFVIYPIETLKTRVMSSTGGTLSGNHLIAKTAGDMWRKGGIRLYFKGLTAGLVGVFPYSAIDMSTFEGIKLAYTKWAGEEPGIPGSLAFGALSGGIGATSVYPLNLIRTRLQAQGTPAHPQTYTGIRDAATKCYRLEGWRGFYKGLTPTLVKVVPAVAISYAVYDATKKILFRLDADPEALHDSEDS